MVASMHGQTTQLSHQILFIDAYDSYSNNIAALLQDQLSVHVSLIHIDDPRFVSDREAFHLFLHQFSAVVVGPGPGHPANTSDTGVINFLWNLPTDHVLPILGICLGFQSLCLAFGAEVSRLHEPRHGLVAEITHSGSDIFEDTKKVRATQYHSLHVLIGEDSSLRDARDLWSTSSACQDLVPLGWDCNDARNGNILMAARHRTLPFWGVQYHPESICTCDEGRKMVRNWWQLACAWNRTHGRAVVEKRKSFHNIDRNYSDAAFRSNDNQRAQEVLRTVKKTVRWKKMKLSAGLDTAAITTLFRTDTDPQPIVLESGQRDGRPVNPETGRFSIIGLHDSSSPYLRYCTADRKMVQTTHGELEEQTCSISTMYETLKSSVQRYRAADGPANVPFWGGLVGYVSYEAGLEGIDVAPASFRHNDRPDVWFVLVERSIVVDHIKGVAYLQTIRDEDEEWLDMAEGNLVQSNEKADPRQIKQSDAPARVLAAPVTHEYCEKILACQAQLRAGCSYELCLTEQTSIRSSVDPWELYCRLRQLNPAPFGAYFRLDGGCTNTGSKPQGLDVVSSSPERFLSWSRDGNCQFRPIKGTIKKGHGVDRSVAERELGSAKEQAENLMIVDLIRHDLNGVARTGSVRVPKLMTIEEYETVFQLVSVIEGDLEPEYSGISALMASLPPGSMTGAPKKRSCQLLRNIEGTSTARGLYSGVIGYLDVGGGGDFSVVIRTAFKWDDGDWQVGAGGAITVLSEQNAEFEEMATKRETLLKAFGAVLTD